MKIASIFYSCWVLLIGLWAGHLNAQSPDTFQLRGNVYADRKIDYSSVDIQLLKNDGKTIVKIELPDSLGNFKLERIKEGEYYLMFTGLNIEKYLLGKVIVTRDQNLGKIKLTVKYNNLAEASITSTKPLIQQFYDRIVVNVANSITAVGSTALDVLAKSPGVTVDKDDNIAMRGRKGVLIMIDGKLVPITGSDLAAMLRNMSSNQIDRIDLITNPSAKYDASGNSGIIDIHLKKDTRIGTNGSVTSSYGEGRYPKFASGINLNNRTGKLNVFGSYNYGDRHGFNDLQLMRTFYDSNNLPFGGYNESNYLKGSGISHNVRIGADYYITPKTIIGFVASGLYFDNKQLITNNTLALNNKGLDTSSFRTSANNDLKGNNKSINLNFKTALDTSGRELTADLDYAIYDRTNLQNYLTRYYNLQAIENQNPYVLFGNLAGNLTIKSVKGDYSQSLGKKARLEAGLKSSWVASDNKVNFFNQSNGGNVLDTSKSNHFIYDENVNAAYVNTSGKWGNTSLQLGLRLENTIAKGVQLTDNSSFNRNYTQLFPSGYLGYKVGKNNEISVSASRRINRPTYTQLNPFKLFLDPTTYLEGNPFLTPETTESFEFNWTFKESYLLKAGYSLTHDNIIAVLLPDVANSNVTVQKPLNIAKYKYFNFSLSVRFTIGKWFTSSNDIVAYYGKYTGTAGNAVLNNSTVAFNITNSNTIKFNKCWTGEVSSNYQSGDIYGFLTGKRYGSIDIGVMTKLLHNKANLKLNFADILFTNYYKGTTTISSYRETFIQHNDTRVATISFTYKFGNNGVPPSRRKTSGVEDEKRRAS